MRKLIAVIVKRNKTSQLNDSVIVLQYINLLSQLFLTKLISARFQILAVKF